MQGRGAGVRRGCSTSSERPAAGLFKKTSPAGKVQVQRSRKKPKCYRHSAGIHPPPQLRSLWFAILPRVSFFNEPPLYLLLPTSLPKVQVLTRWARGGADRGDGDLLGGTPGRV